MVLANAMTERKRMRGAFVGARRGGVWCCLLAAAACSGKDDGPPLHLVDGAADRATDIVDDPSAIDGGDASMRDDGGANRDAFRADGSDDARVVDGADDRNPAVDGPRGADQRSDAIEAGPADGGDGATDVSLDGGADAAVDVSADRPSDSTIDRGSDGPVDAGADGGQRKPSGVFGGGPFYSGADTVMPTMRASGFTTMILWSIHVHANGDLVLNDIPLFSNGSYVGSDAAWPGKVATLKTAPTSVTRVEFSVGAGGTTDFESIESLIGSQGTGPTSILYKNFSALKAAIPVTDAINFDDESNYDVASTVAFGVMLGDLGYKVTLCPYTNSTFWTSVFNQTNTQRPGLVDRVLLQVYAGGASNNPATWSGYFGGLQVEAGLWSRHATNCATGDTPSSVRTKMTNWRSSVAGGWMWLLDDMLTCDTQYPLEDYATAINEALNP
jgi:hypothetical protein